MIWQHGEETLKVFLKILNSCHPTIKFTAEYSLDKVNFLVVEVTRSGSKLLTDLYIKPTDTHQYLELSSSHLYHSKKSIPYSQPLRFNRFAQKICFLKIDVINFSAALKIEGTMKKLLDNKF